MAKWVLRDPYCTKCEESIKFCTKSHCKRCDKRFIPKGTQLAYLLIGWNTKKKIQYESLIEVVDYLLRKNVDFKCELQGDNAKYSKTLGESLSKGRSFFSSKIDRVEIFWKKIEKVSKILPALCMRETCGLLREKIWNI